MRHLTGKNPMRLLLRLPALVHLPALVRLPVLAGLFVFCLASALHAAPLPHIVVLATGGTIAGAADARSQAGYNAGKVSPEQLLAAVPGLDKVARISTEQIASIGSQDMNEEVWFKLAKQIGDLLAQDDVDGVVVTHGTDTMEETALFLDLVEPRGKPVVLTGSMRPSTATSADGPLNLLEAIMVAASPDARGRGTLVVLNDTIHGAVDVTKTSTTSVQTFRSPNVGALGHVSQNGVSFFRSAQEDEDDTIYKLPANPPLPAVAIIYAHAGMNPDVVKDAIEDGAKGLVLAGVGDGNASKATIEALAEAVKAGVVVVRSTRTGSGPVLRNIEIDDDSYGFATAHYLNPAKARVLLQVLLANNIADAAQVQKAYNSLP